LSERLIRLTKEVSQNPSAITDKGVLRVLSTSASEGQMHYDLGFVRIPQKDTHMYVIILSFDSNDSCFSRRLSLDA
jgi:hypothetical protein